MDRLKTPRGGPEGRVTDWLARVIARPEVHARWLNTLSLLEHIGTRKILKSQDSTTLTTTMLQHVAEEARHAYFFRRLSDKVWPDRCRSYEAPHLLAGDGARSYFQTLDAVVAARLSAHRPPAERTWLSYLYVTTLIEERAGWLYPLYDRLLAEATAGLSLKKILAEEAQHLAEMRESLRRSDPQAGLRLGSLRVVEDAAFAVFTEQLMAAHEPQTVPTAVSVAASA